MKILNSFVLCLALALIGPSVSFAEHHDEGEAVKMESPQPEKAVSKKSMKKKRIAKKASKKKKRYKKRMAKKKKNKKTKKVVE